MMTPTSASSRSARSFLQSSMPEMSGSPMSSTITAGGWRAAASSASAPVVTAWRLEAGLLEAVGEQTAHVALVVNHEDSCAHLLILYHGRT